MPFPNCTAVHYGYNTDVTSAFQTARSECPLSHVLCSSYVCLVQDRWKKIPGVQFHHLGQIQFRDTPEEFTLLQVNSERYTFCQPLILTWSWRDHGSVQ